jgi:hypothetical protein
MSEELGSRSTRRTQTIPIALNTRHIHTLATLSHSHPNEQRLLIVTLDVELPDELCERATIDWNVIGWQDVIYPMTL